MGQILDLLTSQGALVKEPGMQAWRLSWQTQDLMETNMDRNLGLNGRNEEEAYYLSLIECVITFAEAHTLEKGLQMKELNERVEALDVFHRLDAARQRRPKANE